VTAENIVISSLYFRLSVGCIVNEWEFEWSTMMSGRSGAEYEH
jgi:hypothetical protein